MWVTVSELPRSVSHPFTRNSSAVGRAGFDDFVEAQCRPFYAEKMGRPVWHLDIFPSPLAWLLRRPGLGTRHCWRAADCSGVRAFKGLALTEAAPDHSTISRTRRLIDLDTHRAVFTWVLQCLGIAGLVKGKTIAIK